MTKLAPQLSPLCPPKDLFINFGIKMEVNKPEKKQYINNKILDIFNLVKYKKSIVAIEIIISEGLIS